MKIGELIKQLWQKLGLENRVDYVCGDGEALPLPLTAERELKVLKSLVDGEKIEREQAKEQLIKHNLRLVVFIARKFDNTGVDLEDLISVGTLGLIKAVKTFNTDKNIKLATYASRCIENEILMHLRRVVKLKGEVSLDEPLNVDYEGNELLLSDVLGTDSDVVYKDIETSAEKEMLREAMTKLSPRERQIMNLRFGLNGGEELTQKQVADMLGISQSYISRLEKKILNKLKIEMSNNT